ncbi:hypothetical protein CL634_04475 [bacterium]|nr:hypothetical protein [bacterium]
MGLLYNPYEKTQYSDDMYYNYSDSYIRSGALHASDHILLNSTQPTEQTFRRGIFHNAKYYQIASDSNFNNILVDSRKRVCQNEHFFSESLSFDIPYYIRFDGETVGYTFSNNAFKFVYEQGNIPVVIAGSVHPATHPYNIILSPRDDKLYATSNGWFDPVKDSSLNYLLSFSPEYDAQGVPNEAARIDIDGTGAAGLDFCPINEDVYVANFASHDISVVSYSNSSAMSQRKLIEVGQNPVDVTYSPSTDKMYVFHSGETTIKSIDPTNFDHVKNIVHSNILLGGNYGVYCPSNQKIYITNPTNDNLMCFDPLTESVELVDVKSYSNKGVYCPYNDRIYITHSTDNIISVINPQENVVEATVVEGVKEGVHGIAYSPAINKVFVTNHNNDLNSQGTASYLNPETNAFDGHMDLGVYPNDIVCDISRTGIMWTTNYGTDNLYFIRNI